MKRRLAAGLLVAALTAVLAPVARGFGGDLSQAPDNPITCAMGWPNQLYPIYGFGPQFYGPYGQGSCAWLSGGTTTTSYAPATGTVTSVSVRVGATTGPMRVVVLRSLYENKAGDPGHPFFACCVAQAYSGVFTPKANAVTTVPTSIAVKEDPTPPPEDTTTIADGDALGLEVLAPNVPVPAHVTSGGATDVNHPDFGWFPALSKRGLTTPSTNVVGYEGDWSGFDVLLDGTMGGGAPALRFPDATLPVRNNRISLPLRCVGAGCQGTVRLQNRRKAQLAHVAGLLARKKKRVVTYGSARFKVEQGKTGHVKVKLNRRGRALARRKGPAHVWANLAFAKGSKGKARSIRLKLTG